MFTRKFLVIMFSSKMMAFGKGKFVLFFSFREEETDISDWFSVSFMVTILMGAGVSLDIIKSSNAVLC